MPEAATTEVAEPQIEAMEVRGVAKMGCGGGGAFEADEFFVSQKTFFESRINKKNNMQLLLRFFWFVFVA